MANAQPASPTNLRPMRPIQRVPFVEETLPLVGPPLTDPNNQPFATAPAPASFAASAPSAGTPSFVTAPSAATPSFVPSAAAAPSFPSALASAVPSAATFASTPSAAGALSAIAPVLGSAAPALGGAAPIVSEIASAAPAAGALLSSPSAAGALGMAAPALGTVAPALGGAAPLVSEIASAAPAAAALISSPSAATALGAVAPTLSAAAPNTAPYANPLLQNIAYQDPTLANADRVAGIGQSHPAEDARVSEAVKSFAETAATKAAAARLAVVPALEALGVAAAKVVGGAGVGAVYPSKPAY